jgi:hypothetical protein
VASRKGSGGYLGSDSFHYFSPCRYVTLLRSSAPRQRNMRTLSSKSTTNRVVHMNLRSVETPQLVLRNFLLLAYRYLRGVRICNLLESFRGIPHDRVASKVVKHRYHCP